MVESTSEAAAPTSLASGSWAQPDKNTNNDNAEGEQGVEVTPAGATTDTTTATTATVEFEAPTVLEEQPPVVEPSQPTPPLPEQVKQDDPVTTATANSNSKEAAATDQMQDKLDEVVQAPYRYEQGRHPEEEAWFIGRLFFFWARPLFRRAAYLRGLDTPRALEHEDLLPLPDRDHGKIVGGVFETAWKRAAEYETQDRKDNNKLKSKRENADNNNNAEPVVPQKLSDLEGSQNRSTQKVRTAVLAVLGKSFWFAGLIKMLNTCLQFSFPLLLNAILKFIEDSQAGKIPDDAEWYDTYRGYWLSAVLFLAMASKAVTENTYFHRVYRSGYQSRVAVSVAVYNKALRLANAERQDTTLGELINLMQVDATKIEMFVPQIHVLWDGLLQITGYMVILYTLIGWPCFVGMALMIAAGPVQGVIMGKLFGRNRQMAKFTDTRVKQTNEALQGVQCVKMYCWEESIEKEISASRTGELMHLKAIAYLRAFSRAYMSALPGLVAVVSFVAYAMAVPDADISASTLFAALASFDQLRFPLLFYPMALAQLSQASVSAARVETFLSMKEVGATGDAERGYTRVEGNHTGGGGEITVEKATVYWSDPKIPISKHDVSDTFSVSSKGSSKKSKSTVKEEETELLDNSAELVYPKAVLANVNFKVAPGELCAIVGRVASGKSTICSAVLNEAVLGSGKITLTGKVAYAAQSPWILNATLRDNILFGMPMNQEKYQQVLKASQLTYDLDLLENGDMTEIGERGINLSGGQKQRVSIARAAYSDADTIILDDPLSALDPEVGGKLFDECIVKLMKGKTRLLVTNQLQFLQFCDNIVALGRGHVLEQGTFEDLNAKEDGEVSRLLSDLAAGKEASRKSRKGNKGAKTKEEDAAEAPANAAPKKPEENKGLVTKEERNIGAVASAVYRKYILAGGGYMKFAIVYFGFILSAANTLASSAWIAFWTSDSSYELFSQNFYLGMYAVIAIVLGLLTFFRTFLLVRFGCNASQVLHKNLLATIMNAPQSFFDTTPLGRILSRFSKDIYSIDIELNEYMDFFLFMSLNVIVSIGTIVFVTPWFGVALPPLGFVYFKVLNYFRNVARETKRLESVSRSPVYAQFSESLGGLTTIRAYGESDRFIQEFENRVDHNIQAFYCNKAADRWLSVRLECIGAVIAGLAAFFACLTVIAGGPIAEGTESNFASMAGLSLTFAISIVGLLNWCVRSFAQLEAAMNACERVLYYTEEIPQEAPRTTKLLEDQVAKGGNTDTPSALAIAAQGGKVEALPKDWPSTGAITLNNLKMRYRSDTPLVLKGLSVAIAGGERIGVVGRTGSGKSSLLLTLLRLVEPAMDEDISKYEAPLTIDGVDTLRIGLRDLRSKLGIIPQHPVLFSGTIRSNMDPFDDYSDDQIWAALERCGTKQTVEEMPNMLEATVAEYGENLSAGTRQMLVLGRACLKKSRILLLDEATSSVDYETDREIQRTIREAFPGCTVLTIAHRIETVMDSDKILVMKDGQAAEFAPPQELLKDPNSIFSDIVRHAEKD